MDNASDDGTHEMCRMLGEKHPGIVRHVRLKRNLGTNAYALGFLQARYSYLVDMDDDILALSKGWDQATIAAFRDFPRLGFLAMNVVQDKYTNGAKRDISEYSRRNLCITPVALIGMVPTDTTKYGMRNIGGITRNYCP